MATQLPNRPRSQLAQRRSFAVVASQYHPEFVQGLIQHFRAELAVIAPETTIAVFDVPGAFEIPVVAQEVALSGRYDALICFGVIVRGATAHADLIAEAVTTGFLQISLKHRIPVIHEVLSVQDEEQARARCLDSGLNRGTEAARTAVGAVLAINDAKTR